ncbi:MAG: hypothetical protein RR999_10770 [Bacteroides sp.]
MKREIITIGRNGRITLPANPQMADFEIAELFGVAVPKMRANIRSLLKSGICRGDHSDGGVVIGQTIYPEYYGLEMIVALSFRINSANARVFRMLVSKRLHLHIEIPQIYIQFQQDSILN